MAALDRLGRRSLLNKVDPTGCVPTVLVRSRERRGKRLDNQLTRVGHFFDFIFGSGGLNFDLSRSRSQTHT